MPLYRKETSRLLLTSLFSLQIQYFHTGESILGGSHLLHIKKTKRSLHLSQTFTYGPDCQNNSAKQVKVQPGTFPDLLVNRKRA